jgi:hypothetical protein
MMRTVDFAYAGARIQARYGARLPPASWERLLRVGGLDAFLQAARDTGLRAWTLQLDPQAGAHQIEAQLRALFRRHVAELARWAPTPWRRAIEWCAVLPDLPAVAHRLRGGMPAAWMANDARLAWLAAGERPALPDELKILAPAKGRAPDPAAAWLKRWRELWRATVPSERAGLEQLVQLLRATVAAAAIDAPAALEQARLPLRRLFRRHTRGPAGLFIHLLLTWQELVAVRGALLRRRLGLPIEAVT